MFDTLADTVAETEANKGSNTLEHVKTKGVFDRMADTLPEDMKETFSHTLFDTEVEHLIDENPTKDRNPKTS